MLSSRSWPFIAAALAVASAFEAKPMRLKNLRREASWPAFYSKVESRVLAHPIVKANDYTKWFAGGKITEGEARDLVIQFSVFSNLFLEAQLAKVINAASLDEMREGKEILANELGVVFNNRHGRNVARARDPHPIADGLDHELVATEGTVEGGIFHFKAGHYEWLLDVGDRLGIDFEHMGKRRHGCPSTLHFCDALRVLYGSEDAETALAASFAVENWAAAGFWDELVEGWKGFNAARDERVPIGFWTHHAAIEAQHADHTMDELKEVYMAGRITDEDAFLMHCDEILDSIKVFWDGLQARRLGLDMPLPKVDYSVGGRGYKHANAPFGGVVREGHGKDNS